MHKRFKVNAADSSKNIISGKISFQENDFSNITMTNARGKDNKGFSLTSLTSHDIDGATEEHKEDEHEVVTDGNWVSIPKLGIRHKKELLTALRHYYNTRVHKRRTTFHHTMSKIEHKVNDILDYVESMNKDLKFRRMSPASFYEIRAKGEVDVFLVLERFPSDVTVEELGSPQGRARIRIPTFFPSEFQEIGKSLRSFMIESEFDSLLLSAKSVGGRLKSLVQQCFEEVPKSWRQASPSCRLNPQVYQVAKNSVTKSCKTPRKVSFEKINNTAVEDFSSTIINLIPVIECPSFWPLCSKWLKSASQAWPDPTLLKTIVQEGVHLVAMPTNKDVEDVWVIKFLNARRCLINHEDNDVKKSCLQIVKVLCDNEVGFSSSFLPIHLEHLFMQKCQQQAKQDWVEDKMAQRFLEVLAMLHGCLTKRHCPSFFIPEANLFSGMSFAVSEQLSRIVMRIMNDPLKYLLK